MLRLLLSNTIRVTTSTKQRSFRVPPLNFPYPFFKVVLGRASYSTATTVRTSISANGIEGTSLLSGKMTNSIAERLPRTKLVFQLPEHQETSEHETKITAIYDYDSLQASDQALLKVGESQDTSAIHALVFESTIFHAQGGGQPSDVGYISVSRNGENGTEGRFNVLMVRQSANIAGAVLHFGHFTNGDISSTSLKVGDTCVQHIDLEKRMLFSRYHTAGHVLGAATRTLLESKIPGFDELKASHFPDSASCEFKGLIEGKWKGDIQGAVDQLLDKNLEVKIEWWTKADFKAKSLERLLPSDEAWKEIGEFVDMQGKPISGEGLSEEDSRIRVVNIVGAEVYPCGGTHVATIKQCGKVGVRKISRQKGVSRVSYNVD